MKDVAVLKRIEKQHNNESIISNNYTGVDFVKFLLCLCIIGIHTSIYKNFTPLWEMLIGTGIFRLAVPYFFVASGFFFGKKLEKSENIAKTVKEYILRLLKPYIVFEIINVLQVFVLQLQAGNGAINILKTLSQHLIFYPYGALWYVWASIIAVLLLYPFLKSRKITLALAIGLVLYAFALMCNSYYFVADATFLKGIVDGYLDICITARNGLFTGFLFIALGIKCSQIDKKYSLKKILLVVLVIFAIYLFEISVVFNIDNSADDMALFISHLLLIPSFFLLTLNININIKKSTSVYLRNLSTGMYFLHRPIQWFIDRILNLNLNHNILIFDWFKTAQGSSIFSFFAVLLVAFVICAVAYKLKKEPLYSLLR